MFIDAFTPAPEVRPMFNVGSLFDIQTGRYLVGEFGESVLCGGTPLLTGVCGRGNTYKSTVADFFKTTILDRYISTSLLEYDTEQSKSPHRYTELQRHMRNIAGRDLVDEGRLRITDATMYSGNKWFDTIKEVAKAREKAKAQLMRTTPFFDRKGEQIRTMVPGLAGVDSLSQLRTDVVNELTDKGTAGGSERNVEAMRDASSKTQILNEMPELSASAGLYFIMTAHVGDKIQMDPYAPNPKKLGFLGAGASLKNVPEKFTFLTNNLWHTVSATPLLNQTTKAPEFPRNKEDDMRGDTDLMEVKIVNLRGKSGPSGVPFTVICSQSEGLLAGLSEFNYIRQFDRFGLGGNVQNYFLDLCPDISLSRTTIRGKIDGSWRLRRALEITSELCQIINYSHHVDRSLLCTPAELFADIKARGYDWDELLGGTRGYWIFKEDEEAEPLKFVSTLDLLKMRKGLYVPYWMKGFAPKDLVQV